MLDPSATSSVSWLDRDAIVVGVVYEKSPVEALYDSDPLALKCPRVLAAVMNRFVDPSVILSVSISACVTERAPAPDNSIPVP